MISIEKHSTKFENEYLAYIKSKMKTKRKFNIKKLIEIDYLEKTINKYKCSTTIIEQDFVDKFNQFIIDIDNDLDSLIIGILPDILITYDNICKKNKTFIKMLNNEKYNDLFNIIIKGVFDYDSFIGTKKEISYKILQDFGISVCPYCNQEGAYSICNESTQKFRSDFDHFLPKSKYPQFSISLYNLIPACHVCNTIKKDEIFSLENNIYPFLDGIEKEIVFSYKPIDFETFYISINSKNNKFLSNRDALLLEERYNKMCDSIIIEKEKFARMYTKDNLEKIKMLDKELKKISILEVLDYCDDINIIRNNPYKKFKNDISMQIYNDLQSKK